MLIEKWLPIISTVDYAFQPIVNPFTGKTFALEALIRHTDGAGYGSIDDFFDEAYADKVLFEVDGLLREKALKKFLTLNLSPGTYLFYNYDPRVFEMPDYRFGVTEELLQKYKVKSNMICYELNEKNKFTEFNSFGPLMERFKQRGVKVAIDDFGAGFAGFELFYHSEPDFLKLDRFLIQGIHQDHRKRTFCTHIVNLAKMLGVITVAEGIETKEDFEACKGMGFDLVQGFYIQRPMESVEDLRTMYSHVINDLGISRTYAGDAELITREIKRWDTIMVTDHIQVLFDKFHDNLQFDFFPVLDELRHPLGIIHHRNIKKYIYSPFGQDLLKNRSLVSSLDKFLTKCPTVDLNTPQEKILELYLNNPDSEGVIITKDQEYFGFLTAKSLLNIITEKKLAFAREMNPLTKLPGNILIKQFIGNAYLNAGNHIYLIYYDLNDFKPFNDKFGFKAGDEAIKLFADTLTLIYRGGQEFIGHIGGDDFFIGLACEDAMLNEVIHKAVRVIETFSESAGSLYQSESLGSGGYTSRDRRGRIRRFPSLSASVCILEIPRNVRWLSSEGIAQKLSELKHEAKQKQQIVIHTCPMENTDGTYLA